MLDFPNSPAMSQVFSDASGASWYWDGAKWSAMGTSTAGWPFLPLAGGVMGGNLTLAGNATSPLHAVPLQQVNTAAAGGPFLPLAGGTVTGATTFNATTTFGTGSQYVCTITPGATTSTPIAIGGASAAGVNITGGPVKIGSTGTQSLTLGSIVLGQNNSYASSGTTLNHPVNLLCNPTGSYAAGGLFAAHNSIAIGQDTLAATGSQGISALKVALGSGAGIASTRMAIHADMTINNSDSLGGNPAHVVLLATGATSATQGGTSPHSGSSKGSIYAINPNVRLASGATNLSGIYSAEFDIAVASGASTQEKIGIQIAKTTVDAVQAGDLESDTAFRIIDQFGAAIPSWTQGIDFGMWLAQWPFGSASTLIRARPTSGPGLNPIGMALKNPLANVGLDFSKVVFTTASVLLPGFQVGPSGAARINALAISTTGTATALDAALQVSSVSTIQNGGANYYVGDQVQSADGTILTVSATSATPGAVTGVTVTVPGYSLAPPGNPVAFLNGSGNALAVNMTWTAAGTLSLNPTGRQVLTNLSAAATDAAAATAGVPIGGLYNNAGVVHVRLT